MNHAVKIEFLPQKEFLVIKGYGKLYDPEVTHTLDPNERTWDIIRQQLNNGAVERLKKAASSETAYMLFCNTCKRNDDDKCYDCGYDIACENLNGSKAADDFDIVRLKPCEYAVFDCTFDGETSLPAAHEKSDALFWNEWLKENPYICAIDDTANWLGNGYASIELYSPFDPDADEFNAKIWFPIIRKDI